MPTVNDLMMATINLHVGPGHTLADGMLAYFRMSPGVTATTLAEAEQDWLAQRTVVLDDFTDDLWHQFLTTSGYNLSGNDTNDDMKYRWWATIPPPV